MTDNSHSFSAYFKRVTSPLVVLSLLRERPMYGYEISSEMKARSSGRYTIAVLYPVLYRLQEQGYVEISETEVVDGRARSYYRITENGCNYLKHTLSEYNTITEIFMNLVGSQNE